MSYNPSTTVSNAHNIPHLNSQLQFQENQFSITTSYLTSLLPFPILILSICMILVLGFLCAISCACCCRLCPCKCLTCFGIQVDKLDPIRESYFSKLTERVNHHTLIVRVFISFTLVLFVVNFFVWYGSVDITNAFLSIINGLNGIINFFTSIVNSSSGLINNANSFTQILLSSTCSTDSQNSVTTSILASENEVLAASNTISSLALSVNNSISNIILLIPNYINEKDIVIGCFFTIILIILLGYSTALYFSKKWLFRFCILITWLSVTALFAVSSVEMIIVMFLSDFCIDPSGNLTNILTSPVFAYYITCTGTNPFGNSLNTIASDIASIQPQLDSIYSTGIISQTCYNSLSSVETLMNSNFASLNSLATGCQSINSIYTDIVLNALCTYGFSGVYNLWILQFIIAIALYFIMSFANSVYHTYVFVGDDRSKQMTSVDVANMEHNFIHMDDDASRALGSAPHKSEGTADTDGTHDDCNHNIEMTPMSKSVYSISMSFYKAEAAPPNVVVTPMQRSLEEDKEDIDDIVAIPIPIKEEDNN